MSEHTRFGPAGVPPMFRLLGASTVDTPRLLREEGLDAFEYQGVRWGEKPQIKQQDAMRLGEEARKNDVRLSMHGSYYINLTGKRDVVEASKRRLIAAATAADWMGAYVMVFHTGFYGKFEKDYALKTCISALKEVSAEMKAQGLKVKLGPETMGRKFQVGSIDEIIAINQQVENTQLVVDWGHLHALHQGTFKTSDDMRKIAQKIEEQLGTQTLRSMHCHFSKIEFTAQGEKRHHTLDEAAFGPEFRLLAEVILDFGMHPTMICESPILDVDARKMKETLEQVMIEKQGNPKA
ncbi:MAG: TIM barrel protein [Candidatus Bathyarchaeota archaeon]|nr:TIM barrel protein [Chloroflexota bacterium]MCL5877871.1 TIM barrel protein [Candidatus Bathyarchaeota archaeon]